MDFPGKSKKIFDKSRFNNHLKWTPVHEITLKPLTVSRVVIAGEYEGSFHCISKCNESINLFWSIQRIIRRYIVLIDKSPRRTVPIFQFSLISETFDIDWSSSFLDQFLSFHSNIYASWGKSLATSFICFNFRWFEQTVWWFNRQVFSINSWAFASIFTQVEAHPSPRVLSVPNFFDLKNSNL